MPTPRTAVAVLLSLLVLPASLSAQEMADVTGIFDSHEPLDITIWANFDELDDDRDQEEEYRPGRIAITEPDGTTHELSLEIKTRGRFRLKRDTCRFPPLRINLVKGEIEGTFLEGQDKSKLVTHCHDRDEYEQNVLEEYLVYRMFNVLTDNSMRVRLARMTYHNTGSDDEEMIAQRWGFLLEDEDVVAERLGGEYLELADEGMEQLHPARLVGRNIGPVLMFNYMVGNTDFSMYGDHNVKLVDRGNEIIPVPYDFDWTGFVNAPYARPDPGLGIREVRQRLYRGYCRPDVNYQELYQLFNSKRAEIEELIRTQPALTENNREGALEYVGDFYEIINDPGSRQSNIEGACRSFGAP